MKEKENDIEAALAKNDEEWQKRLLLLILIMMVAILSLD